MQAYAIFTADGLDIIEYSDAAAKRHVKDLKGMGCDRVTVKTFPTDAEAYDYCERKGISC